MPFVLLALGSSAIILLVDVSPPPSPHPHQRRSAFSALRAESLSLCVSRVEHSAAPCARWPPTTALLVDYSHCAMLYCMQLLLLEYLYFPLLLPPPRLSPLVVGVVCRRLIASYRPRALYLCALSPRPTRLRAADSLSPLHSAIFLCGVSFFAHFKYTTTSTILYSPHHNMTR
jgi:hypothetical protein